MIAEPPLLAGALQLTLADAFSRVAKTLVGGSGTVAGVTAAEAEDSTLFPTAFVACTVNVYAVPFARPVTEHGLVAQEPVAPPTDAVTVKPVTAEPPLFAAAMNEITAEPLPLIAETVVGGPGTVAGVTALDGDDSTLFPTAFVACAVNV